MAYTFVERANLGGASRRPPARKAAALIGGTGYLLSAVLFGLLAWQSQVYAMDLSRAGVSPPSDPDVPFVFSHADAGVALVRLLWMPSGR